MSTNAKAPRRGRWLMHRRAGHFSRLEGSGSSGWKGLTTLLRYTTPSGKQKIKIKPITAKTKTFGYKTVQHPKTGRGGFPSTRVEL